MGSCPSMRTWLGRSTKSSLAALSRGVNLFVVLARTAVQDLTPCCRKVSTTRDGQYSADWSRGWSRAPSVYVPASSSLNVYARGQC